MRDFTLLMICCLGWAGNFVISAWALGRFPVPPFLLAAIRAACVLGFMGLFLFKPRPEKFLTLLAVCACVGPIHLAFLYTGLQTAPAAGSSIVAQMFIPFATVLSVIFLKEKIGWVRGLAIFGAFIGVMIMIYEPAGLKPDIGLVYVMIAYLSLAVGSVLMKKVGDVSWQVYVAWMAFMVLIVMSLATSVFESGHADVWRAAKWPLILTALYGAICVSIIAHGQYFDLVKKYDVSVIVPLTLMMPVFAAILSVLLLKETIFIRYFVGAALIFPCVYIIAAHARKSDGEIAP